VTDSISSDHVAAASEPSRVVEPDKEPDNKRQLNTSKSRKKKIFKKRLKNGTVRIGTWNVNGLKSKAEDVEHSLKLAKIDVAAIQETMETTRSKLTSSFQEYNWVSGVSPPEKSRKGVGFLVHKTVAKFCTAMPVPAALDDVGLLAVDTERERTLICNVYLPTRAKGSKGKLRAKLSAIKRLLKSFPDHRVLLVGDLNGWVGKCEISGPTMGPWNDHGQIIAAWLGKLKFSILNGYSNVVEYTRIRNKQKSVLDYMCVDFEGVSNLMVHNKVRIPTADHVLVSADLHDKCKKYKKPKLKQKPRIHKLVEDAAVRHGFRTELEAYIPIFHKHLETLSKKHNPSRVIRMGTDHITKYYRELTIKWCGLTSMRRRSKVWWDDDCTKAHKLWNDLTHSHADTRVIKAARKGWIAIRRKKRRTYINAMREATAELYETNNKNFWRSMEETKDRGASNIFGLRDQKGKLRTSSPEMAEICSQHYCTLATPVHKPHFDKDFADEVTALSHNFGPGPEELDKDIQLEELAKARKKIRHGKACGPDNVFGESIKCGKEATDKLLFPLFRMCFKAENIHHKLWRRAKIVSIFKDGDKFDMGNYRGISLHSILGKFYVSIFTNRLTSFVEDNNLIDDAQNGFRTVEQRSCTDHVATLTNLLGSRREEGKNTLLTFIDFKKAFPSIDHTMLWYKLQKLGVRGKFLRCIKNMYSKMSSFGSVNGCCGSEFQPKLGTAEGCPLSPILFGIFLNDLIEGVKELELGVDECPILAFADDIVIMTEDSDKMQKILDFVSDWISKWRMTANAKKSAVMAISTGRKKRKREPEDTQTAVEVAADSLRREANNCKLKRDFINLIKRTCPNRHTASQLQRSTKAKLKQMLSDLLQDELKTSDTPPLMLCGEALPFVTDYKYLGIIIDNKLNFRLHADKVLKKCKRQVGRLWPVLSDRHLTIKCRRTIYRAYIASIALYGAEIWAHKNPATLHKVANLAARALCGLSKTCSGVAAREVAGITDLIAERDVATIKLALKVVTAEPERVLHKCLHKSPPLLRTLKSLCSLYHVANVSDAGARRTLRSAGRAERGCPALFCDCTDVHSILEVFIDPLLAASQGNRRAAVNHPAQRSAQLDGVVANALREARNFENRYVVQRSDLPLGRASVGLHTAQQKIKERVAIVQREIWTERITTRNNSDLSLLTVHNPDCTYRTCRARDRIRASCGNLDIANRKAEKDHDALCCPLCGLFCDTSHVITDCAEFRKERCQLVQSLETEKGGDTNPASVLNSIHPPQQNARYLLDPSNWSEQGNQLINRYCQDVEYRLKQASIVCKQPELSKLIDIKHPKTLHENIVGEIFDWTSAKEKWRVRVTDYNPVSNTFVLDSMNLDTNHGASAWRHFTDIDLNVALDEGELTHLTSTAITYLRDDVVDGFPALNNNIANYQIRYRQNGGRFCKAVVSSYDSIHNKHWITWKRKRMLVDLNLANNNNNLRIDKLNTVLGHLRITPQTPAEPPSEAARSMPEMGMIGIG